MDDQGRGGWGSGPWQQRLVGIRQDHSFCVAVALDLCPERFGCSIRQRTALAARATQLVKIHGYTPLAALHPLDHRLIARLPLEADGHGPGFEHVPQRSEVFGLGGNRQSLGDLFDEPLLVGGTHLG